MKIGRLIWDFVFGVLLIGGAPMCALGLVMIISDLLQGLFHFDISVPVGIIVGLASFALAVYAFRAAIIFRSRKRLLPKRFLAGEIALGALGGFFLFAFIGVLEHSIID